MKGKIEFIAFENGYVVGWADPATGQRQDVLHDRAAVIAALNTWLDERSELNPRNLRPAPPSA